MLDLLDRLSRRGVLTIVAEDGDYALSFAAHGPWTGGRATSDKHDLFEYCRLGAKNWHGDGPDFVALLVTCEMETRPDTHDIDDLVWKIECRRNSRTHGPPLPSFMGWYRGGWRPGDGRWLRVSDHRYEYLVGYLHDVDRARKEAAERAVWEARRKASERARAKAVLT